MSTLSESDFADLQAAVAKLETQNFAMTLASKFNMSFEAFLQKIPGEVQAPIAAAVQKSLGQCLQIAMNLKQSNPTAFQNKSLHTFGVAVTGALGGFFGMPGLIVELPVTTIVMLHSIIEIARAEGEDLSNPESALACLQVLALGPQGAHGSRGKPSGSAYYETRAALAAVTHEAATYVARGGAVKGGAPVLIAFVRGIASRFGVEVSDKVVAEALPIVGAIGGLSVNVLFSNYFHRLAEGHFTVRRLERKYGTELVSTEYERARAFLAVGPQQRQLEA